MGSRAKIKGASYKQYLEGFPEEIYDLSDTSHIVRLADALCDSGVGYLRKQNMLNRIQTSLDETFGENLDSFYGEVFGLTRLPGEQYLDQSVKSEDNKDGEPFYGGGLLDEERKDIVRNADAKYRARIWKYMSALPMGGTKAGIRQAAEAAFGCKCHVLESDDFYRSNDVQEGDELAFHDRLITYLDGTRDGDGRFSARYDCILIIVESGTEILEPDSLVYAKNALIRLIPQDVTPIFITRAEADYLFALEPADEEVFRPLSAAASSRWWNRIRYVTGAEDWSYEYDPDKNFWIEPNKRKKAPVLTDYQSQEFVTDYTFMVDEVEASTEHVGDYNSCQTDFYRVFMTDWGRSDHLAWDALASAVNKNFATSLNDPSLKVIDDSYPIDYLPAVLPRYHEDNRARRMWSSQERTDPNEHVEFRFAKAVPLNHISANFMSKPFKVDVLAEVDGTWEPISVDGIPITYTSDSWGGSSIAGDMTNVTFDFDVVTASAIRFEFTRLQDSRTVDNGDGTKRIEKMVYSVELADVSFIYKCLNEADFVASSYPDCFGNLVETEIETKEAINVIDGDSHYWMSQPNPTPGAVEYLILDVRDADRNPQIIDFMEVDSVFSGATMKVYSSYEGEWGGHVWYPYPGIFKLRDGRFLLEERRASFIKLEFTDLAAIPYRICAQGIKTKFRTYPAEARSVQVGSESYSQTYLDQLLATYRGASNASVSASQRYLKTGTSNIYAELNTQEEIAEKIAASQNPGASQYDLWSIDAYRSVYGIGRDSKTEYPIGFNTNPPGWAIEAAPSYSYFQQEQEHFYMENDGELVEDAVYVVGIRSVRFGREEHSTLYESDGAFYARTDDDRYTVNSYNFEKTENGISPNGDKLAVYESRDFDTTCLFDSFDFAVGQKEPQQVFVHPERMAYQDNPEWRSIRNEDEYQLEEAEMGSSGTVARLAREGGKMEGIESQNYLIHADGMAEFHVRLFDLGDKGEKTWWTVEAVEGGQTLYHMEYQVERGGWHTLNSHFQLVPAGGWWNKNFALRVMVKITAERDLPAGTTIFFPALDFLSEIDLGGATQVPRVGKPDLSDLRVVYYDGMKNTEIDAVITGRSELWFALQDDLAAGKTADGEFDQETRRLRGCYYIYYHTDENILDTGAGNPMRNVDKVFDLHVQNNKFIDDDGLCVLSKDGGYIAFDLVPSQTIEVGHAQDVRAYLWRWENQDGSFRADMHIYQDTLVFEVFDGDFRSSVSGSFIDGDIVNGKKVRILGQYGNLGTAQHGEQEDPARGMELYISQEDNGDFTYRKMADTMNVYDLTEYDGNDKFYRQESE